LARMKCKTESLLGLMPKLKSLAQNSLVLIFGFV